MNSSDCAKRILLLLSGNGAELTQVALSQELDVPLDRLGPVVAGLAHNRYLTCDFTVPGILVSLTDEGRRWASSLGSGTTPEKNRSMDQDAEGEEKSATVTMDRQRKRMPTARSVLSSSGTNVDRTPPVAKIVRRPRRAVPAA